MLYCIVLGFKYNIAAAAAAGAAGAAAAAAAAAGRFSASYDQKEDHQLWVNQSSLDELVLSGSFMLGGFFDGSALLTARKQFKNLKRW